MPSGKSAGWQRKCTACVWKLRRASLRTRVPPVCGGSARKEKRPAVRLPPSGKPGKNCWLKQEENKKCVIRQIHVPREEKTEKPGGAILLRVSIPETGRRESPGECPARVRKRNRKNGHIKRRKELRTELHTELRKELRKGSRWKDGITGIMNIPLPGRRRP